MTLKGFTHVDVWFFHFHICRHSHYNFYSRAREFKRLIVWQVVRCLMFIFVAVFSTLLTKYLSRQNFYKSNNKTPAKQCIWLPSCCRSNFRLAFLICFVCLLLFLVPLFSMRVYEQHPYLIVLKTHIFGVHLPVYIDLSRYTSTHIFERVRKKKEIIKETTIYIYLMLPDYLNNR